MDNGAVMISKYFGIGILTAKFKMDSITVEAYANIIIRIWPNLFTIYFPAKILKHSVKPIVNTFTVLVNVFV